MDKRDEIAKEIENEVRRLAADRDQWKELAQARYSKMVSLKLIILELEEKIDEAVSQIENLQDNQGWNR